ncbi:MAG: phenylalanine--tRNA ligase subunit beta [Mariniblastus sp.]
MIVSWNWLTEYVDLAMTHDDLVDRLTMSGLNHEGTDLVDKDQAIDLEVTSNRADCLGHIGVAREIAALYEIPLKIPDPQPATCSDSVSQFCSVEIEAEGACERYTARLIRGVKIGPSPQWMQERLKSLGIGIVNNVVDATNYVMFECGQPLHAFDFSKIQDGKIIVREARAEETFEAIDHRTYQLAPGMCVIADSEDAVALGGVMGGADSEVSEATVDVLIEAAYFDPLTIRSAARKLKLHSPSSFRFERNVDSENLDWASRRVCELILESAGGELLEGVIDVGSPPPSRESINLRYRQLQRLLGIEIPVDFVAPTLEKLGLVIESSDENSVTAIAPSWRKDLTRDVDLVEEVGRIYGFEKIPDDVNVPMSASYRPKADRVVDKVRNVLTAAGFDEAVTPSLVPQPWSDAFTPWCDSPPLISSQPMLGVLEEYSHNIGTVNLLRRSLVPSLLEVRRINDYRSNVNVNLFETAKVYLPSDGNAIPDQPMKLALVSHRDFFAVKGVVEALVRELNPLAAVEVKKCDEALLDASQSGEFWLGEQRLGWIGSVSESAKKQFGLRSAAVVVEVDLGVLEHQTQLIACHANQSPFPPVSRDFNFIMDDEVRWASLEATIRSESGPLLESVRYLETFRDETRDGPGKKRVLFSVVFRSNEATLTGAQAEELCNRIIANCTNAHEATLVG